MKMSLLTDIDWEELEKRGIRKMSTPNKMLIQHVKNNKGQKIGTVVALGPNKLGWSKCNTKLDRFDKAKGVDIAKVRAKINEPDKPHNKYIQKVLDIMSKRAQRYYQDNLKNDNLKQDNNYVWYPSFQSISSSLARQQFKDVVIDTKLLHKIYPHTESRPSYDIVNRKTGEVHGHLYYDYRSSGYRTVFNK